MTWAIHPNRSLFFYETGDNATRYTMENQRYRPIFRQPVAPSTALDSAARTVCGITGGNASSFDQWSTAQRTCYYDTIVTGDTTFGQRSYQAAEQQVKQREAMRNPPTFNTDQVPLRVNVRELQSVNLIFNATSEFSATIVYQLLKGPQGAQFDSSRGRFDWNVPKNGGQTEVTIKVSAEDGMYRLVSTHEVVLEIAPTTGGHASRFRPSALFFVSILVKVIRE
jgi:hypothetical protein